LLTRPARLGLGVRFGNGRQFMSWISLADAVAAVIWVLHDATLEGPVNVTAPDPVTNAEFACCLAETLKRPAIGYAPGWALELPAGRERAREVFLSSQRGPCSTSRQRFLLRVPRAFRGSALNYQGVIGLNPVPGYLRSLSVVALLKLQAPFEPHSGPILTASCGQLRTTTEHEKPASHQGRRAISPRQAR
jgi:hypothetical protein